MTEQISQPKPASNSQIEVLDFHPPADDIEQDVLEGLGREDKYIKSKWLYDEEGSKLFDDITETEAYYPTETELAILSDNADDIARRCGQGAAVIELGSGSSLKIRRLLDILDQPSAYVPVEISRSHLEASAEELAGDLPGIEILPVCADFLGEWDLPDLGDRPRVMFFPGSTYGNFEPDTRELLLTKLRKPLRRGTNDCLLIGVDLRKPLDVLLPAYDDPEGASAAFALNVLDRLNRELDADFDRSRFSYEARYNDGPHRIEMGIVSEADQAVTVAGKTIELSEGERIHTENSYKFTVEGFLETAAGFGLKKDTVWTDAEDRFAFMRLIPV